TTVPHLATPLCPPNVLRRWANRTYSHRSVLLLDEPSSAWVVASGCQRTHGTARSAGHTVHSIWKDCKDLAKRRSHAQAAKTSAATVGYEAQLWQMADALRGSMDAAEYKHVVLGLIFLKYISDAFEEQHAKL